MMSSKRLKKAVQENYSNHFKSVTEESVGCFIKYGFYTLTAFMVSSHRQAFSDRSLWIS